MITLVTWLLKFVLRIKVVLQNRQHQRLRPRGRYLISVIIIFQQIISMEAARVINHVYFSNTFQKDVINLVLSPHYCWLV